MASSMRRYFCKLCGAAYATHRTDRLFCCPEHQKEFLNSRIKQGLRIIDLALASRMRRGSKDEVAKASQARRDFYNELDRICAEERERTVKRSAKIAEIRAGGLQPQPIETIEASDEIPDQG